MTDLNSSGSKFQRQDEALQRLLLPAIVTRMAVLFDGTRTVEEVCRASGVPLLKGQAVARKLCSLGAIRKVDHGLAAHFSPLEEAFFAAEPEPHHEFDEPSERWTPRLRRALVRLLGRARTRARE